MSNKIRIGVIGCGVVAPAHIESYLHIPGVEVVALCDIIPEKCSSLASQYALKSAVYDDCEKMFSACKLDAVSVCTDHASHSQICSKAFGHGINVLCEKPLASNQSGLDEMLTAWKKSRHLLIFEPVFQNRFNPVFIALKEIVSQGALGKILNCGIICNFIRTHEYYKSAPWRGTWSGEGGSALINQAIHYLDLMLWICGRVESVTAFYGNLTHKDSIETEDTVSASLRLENGALASISVSSSGFNNWQNILWINGTDGFLTVNGGQIEKMQIKESSFISEFKKIKEANSNNQQIKVGSEHYGNLHYKQIKDFCDSLLGIKKPFIDPYSAAETVKTVFRIYNAGKER